MDRIAVAGETQREELARPRTIAASRGLGLRGGSGSRALAPSGEAISEGLSAENVISSSG